jgi:hypothetical protein
MAPMQPPDHLQRLVDFEMVRELGRGGMGVVYEAHQVSLNCKVLSAGLGLTEKAVRAASSSSAAPRSPGTLTSAWSG